MGILSLNLCLGYTPVQARRSVRRVSLGQLRISSSPVYGKGGSVLSLGIGGRVSIISLTNFWWNSDFIKCEIQAEFHKHSDGILNSKELFLQKTKLVSKFCRIFALKIILCMEYCGLFSYGVETFCRNWKFIKTIPPENPP